MSYYLLHSGEDGTTVDCLNEAELLARITPTKFGDTYYGCNLQFLSYVPTSDKGCWTGVPENSVLIIKGDVVVPKPITTVTEWSL